ncbi:hypothetical protein AAIR98_001274 [Elusimicrobium simillimum]|uniref:hypothetical protein n=1 Tax=Elusimicrobium simillimum TaxID=3143438 RepID=UPI003C702FA9
MKKYIAIIIASAFCLASANANAAEPMKMTTYYPTPYASYDNVAVGETNIATDKGGGAFSAQNINITTLEVGGSLSAESVKQLKTKNLSVGPTAKTSEGGKLKAGTIKLNADLESNNIQAKQAHIVDTITFGDKIFPYAKAAVPAAQELIWKEITFTGLDGKKKKGKFLAINEYDPGCEQKSSLLFDTAKLVRNGDGDFLVDNNLMAQLVARNPDNAGFFNIGEYIPLEILLGAYGYWFNNACPYPQYSDKCTGITEEKSCYYFVNPDGSTTGTGGSSSQEPTYELQSYSKSASSLPCIGGKLNQPYNSSVAVDPGHHRELLLSGNETEYCMEALSGCKAQSTDTCSIFLTDNINQSSQEQCVSGTSVAGTLLTCKFKVSGGSDGSTGETGIIERKYYEQQCCGDSKGVTPTGCAALTNETERKQCECNEAGVDYNTETGACCTADKPYFDANYDVCTYCKDGQIPAINGDGVCCPATAQYYWPNYERCDACPEENYMSSNGVTKKCCPWGQSLSPYDGTCKECTPFFDDVYQQPLYNGKAVFNLQKMQCEIICDPGYYLNSGHDICSPQQGLDEGLCEHVPWYCDDDRGYDDGGY